MNIRNLLSLSLLVAAFQGPAVIQRHNFKTRWKPFMIAPPHETFSGEWTNGQLWPWYLPC